jgi:predicted nucleic acid-binding protein
VSRRPRGLIDTSVYIATESGRQLDLTALPDEWFASVVTLAELTSGVLAAKDLPTRSRRLGTLNLMDDAELLPIDEEVASEWARLRAQVSAAGRRANVNDLWIAATAAAHRLPVVTQDADFDLLAEIGGIEIIRV